MVCTMSRTCLRVRTIRLTWYHLADLRKQSNDVVVISFVCQGALRPNQNRSLPKSISTKLFHRYPMVVTLEPATGHY